MRPASGSFDGLSTSCVSPSVVVTRYSTPGAVVTRSTSNSRSSRSCTISMCSRPRKPQRNPKPSAADVSGSNANAASFNFSFSSASRSSGILVPFDGIEPGEHHRLHFLEAGEGLGGRARGLRDRVADLRVAETLDVGDDEADLADAEALDGQRLGREDPDLIDVVRLAVDHHRHLHAGTDGAVDDADLDDHAAVGVVPGVEDQGLERRLGRSGGRRHAFDDRLEDVADADAFLGAGEDGAVGVEPDDLLDLPLGLVGHRAGQVDLVDDRDDLEVVVGGEVGVGERLRLHALRRIDQEQRALAGRRATA